MRSTYASDLLDAAPQPNNACVQSVLSLISLPFRHPPHLHPTGTASLPCAPPQHNPTPAGPPQPTPPIQPHPPLPGLAVSTTTAELLHSSTSRRCSDSEKMAIPGGVRTIGTPSALLSAGGGARTGGSPATIPLAAPPPNPRGSYACRDPNMNQRGDQCIVSCEQTAGKQNWLCALGCFCRTHPTRNL